MGSRRGRFSGYPFLAAAGRFAAKGAIMLGASLGYAADSAKQLVVKRAGPVEDSHVGQLLGAVNRTWLPSRAKFDPDDPSRYGHRASSQDREDRMVPR